MRIVMMGLMGGLCLLATGAQAQERTAIGGTDTQMTWSALSTLINGVDTKTDAVNSRVDQVVVCAKKGMVYAPGAPGTDAQGCGEAAQSGNTSNTFTSLVNKLNTTNTNLTNLTNTSNATNTKVSNILSCNAQGKVYNGSSCISGIANCKLTSHTGNCKAGEVAISTLQNQHFGGGGSPNGTGFDGTGTATYCLAVSCN